MTQMKTGVGLGLHMAGQKVKLTAHAALELGDVIVVDMTSGTTEKVPDTTAACGAGQVVSATQELGVMAVALEGVASGADGFFQITGLVDAYVIKSSGNVAIGDPLVAITGSQDLDGTTATGERVWAYAMEAATGPSTHTTIKVLLNGWGGFGTAT